MFLLNAVFQLLPIPKKTVEYCCYPGSYFESQLVKFRTDPELAKPTTKELQHLELHMTNEAFIQAKLELLKCKILHTDWNEKLSQFATTFKLT